MKIETAVADEEVTGETPRDKFGKIAIRVVVLPIQRKDVKPSKSSSTEIQLLDLEEDEMSFETGKTPLSSYLETSKGGKQCVVFLVNGQRQDSLDNSFIVQQLGFKYLRNRMMIIVDVDGLTPEAIGRLMQGSRQTFYRGDVWDAMTKRLVATLKDDPDLVRLEEEAEEEVSELKAGDEKVKQTLDQLIDAHHEHGIHFAEGNDAQGGGDSTEHLGIRTIVREGVVSLLLPDHGMPADYPVLISQPASSSIRLRPNQDRDVSIKSMPSNAMPALAEFIVENDPSVPELQVSSERLTNFIKMSLHFSEPGNFDTDQYPVRATLRATARFNGIREPRRLELKIVIKPDRPEPDLKLNDTPTWLQVSSREPIKIKIGKTDTHVRLRWDGKDELAIGPNPRWSFQARLLNPSLGQPAMNFSEPAGGRFSLLITPDPAWHEGMELTFEVTARSSSGSVLTTTFSAEVVAPPDEVERVEKQPRLVDAEVLGGSKRRPPYVLKYIGRNDYETGTCWGQVNWTDEDPGCFQDPTERSPLTLIINEDMGEIREYRRYLTRRFTESEVERRINKYTSHVAFHLYQMYQASQQETEAENAEQRRRAEIQRVASTLIRLMEVSR